MRKFLVFAASAAASLGLSVPALANTTLSASVDLDGSAVTQSGSVKIVSQGTASAGSVTFSKLNGEDFEDLTHLSVDFNVTDDNCGGGSPRFSIGVDTDNNGTSNGNVHVYLGAAPNFNSCPQNTWISSGNLIASTDARFDLTQFGGAFYSTYAQANALLGSGSITSILLAVDGGWNMTDQEQTVLFDNVRINGHTFDFAAKASGKITKDQCKRGGWRLFSRLFRNQGQCIKHHRMEQRSSRSSMSSSSMSRSSMSSSSHDDDDDDDDDDDNDRRGRGRGRWYR